MCYVPTWRYASRNYRYCTVVELLQVVLHAIHVAIINSSCYGSFFVHIVSAHKPFVQCSTSGRYLPRPSVRPPRSAREDSGIIPDYVANVLVTDSFIDQKSSCRNRPLRYTAHRMCTGQTHVPSSTRDLASQRQHHHHHSYSTNNINKPHNSFLMPPPSYLSPASAH